MSNYFKNETIRKIKNVEILILYDIVIINASKM